MDRTARTPRAPSPLPALRHAGMKRSAGAHSPALLRTVDERSPFRPAGCTGSQLPGQPDSPASSSAAGPLPLSSSLPNLSVDLPATPCPHPRAGGHCLPVPAAATAAAAAPGTSGSFPLGTSGSSILGGEALGALLQGEAGGLLLCMLRREAARRLLLSLHLRALRLAVTTEAAAWQRAQAGSLL